MKATPGDAQHGTNEMELPQHVATLAFGPTMQLEHHQLHNGLRVLLLPDRSAPVLAFHSWFRVGSRHERPGKTGISHLFEHLMFNETDNLPKGSFDRKLEEVGAESNASTWLDFTQYNIFAPSDQLKLIISMEADRMEHLVLRDPQVQSEKEVVANERRYRVDDDIEGTVNEELWKHAFVKHAYHWPTIGWMEDIESFTTQDCEAFYRTYYAPNNCTLVLVGDFDTADALRVISNCYGHMPASQLPLEDVNPEPPQMGERELQLNKPTSTEKLSIGYRAPALGDFDHVPLSLLCDILFGGRASRIHRKLIRELELASDLRMFVGPFRDPGLMEFYATVREGHTAQEVLEALDAELDRVKEHGVTEQELRRNIARFEFGLLHSLETAEGKANTIGFYDCVLGQPAAAFERMDALRRVTLSDLLRVARRYFQTDCRTRVVVKPLGEAA
jgi:zinc protease